MRYFFAKSLIKNQIRLFRLYPTFSDFQTFRLNSPSPNQFLKQNGSWTSVFINLFYFLSGRLNVKGDKEGGCFQLVNLAAVCLQAERIVFSIAAQLFKSELDNNEQRKPCCISRLNIIGQSLPQVALQAPKKELQILKLYHLCLGPTRKTLEC